MIEKADGAAGEESAGEPMVGASPGPVPSARSPEGDAEDPGQRPAGEQPEPAGAGGEDSAGAAGAPPPENRYGRPGRPLARSPFVVGFLAGLGLLLAYTAFLLIRDAMSMLILVFIALFLAIGLNPAVVRLRRWGLPRGLAVTAVALGVVLLFCGGLLALIPPLVTQTSALIDNLPEYLDELQRNQTIRQLNEQYQVVDRVRSVATSENAGRVAGGLLGGVQVVFGAVFNTLTVAVLTIYFMASFERLRHGAYRLVPASRRERVQALGDEILAKVGAYMVGALTIALLAGFTSWVFLFIVGIAYPFALAVVVAICDLIPQVGATIGAVLVSAVAFASASVPVGIATVVFFIVYQQVENYLVYPRVMRRAVKVTDLAAIIAALTGVALLGVIGALIAIPAVAGIQLIVREVVIPRQERA